jgi:DNA polymerase-3 subunit gamma/tau
MSAEKMKRLEEEAQMVESEIVVRFIRILSELTNQIRFASQKRVLIEIALIKLTQPSMEDKHEDLVQRIRDLEEKIEKGIVVQQAMPAATLGIEQGAVQVQKPKLQKAVTEEVKAIAEQWNDIIRDVGGHFGVCLRRNPLSIDEQDRLCVVYSSDIDWKLDNKQENIDELKQKIEKRMNRAVDIELRVLEQTEEFESNYMSLMEQTIQFDIEESDD